jgi:hypothetical protein
MSSGITFPSSEWAEAYCRALNESPDYRRLGRGWVWPILFIVTELPDELKSRYPSGSPGFLIDLYDGVCRGVRFYDDTSGVDAPFIISAKFRDWVDVIMGRESSEIKLEDLNEALEKLARGEAPLRQVVVFR